jgi:hypothetical protein
MEFSEAVLCVLCLVVMSFFCGGIADSKLNEAFYTSKMNSIECDVRGKERGFDSTYLEGGECWGEIKSRWTGETMKTRITPRNRYFNLTDIEQFKQGIITSVE